MIAVYVFSLEHGLRDWVFMGKKSIQNDSWDGGVRTSSVLAF